MELEKIYSEILELNSEFIDIEINKVHNEKIESFKYNYGNIPVLVSAPHAVSQVRNEKIKQNEIYTGAYAKYIAKNTGASLIYKCFNNSDDANFDIISDYKNKILDIIKEKNIQLLIDIHGASDKYKFDIDIATNNYKNVDKSIADMLKNNLEKNNVKNIYIDEIFKANKINTISCYISEKTGIPCIQIEITRKYRDNTKINNMNNILNGIIEFIKEGKWIKNI